LADSRQRCDIGKMFEDKASYPRYTTSEHPEIGSDRLPPGPALLAVFGLSLVGWAFVLVPLFATLHR
jgi:hypothetical protein